MAETPIKQRIEQTTQKFLTMDAPLAERLQALAEDVAIRRPAFAAVVERLIEKLRAAGVGEGAPQRGDVMPPFVLPDQDGRLVALESLIAEGPAVLSFHRGGWCPYCRINADALARLAPVLAAQGARIAAITPDVEEFNAELRSIAKAPFPILTDIDNGYALQANVAFKVPDEKRRAMTEVGLDISRSQANSTWILATFVVGRDGRVRAAFIDPDYRKRATHEDIMQAAVG